MKQPEFIPLIEVVEAITVGYVGPMAGEYQEKGIPFLRSLNVKPFKFSETDLKFISPEFHKQISKSALEPGDVVAVRTGNPGASCVIPKTLPKANCSDLVVIRCSKETDPYFVSYYINSITQSIGSQSVGAIQKHFNIGSAKEIKFPKLSFDHQFKAATILRLLDEKIELNNRINAELEGLAKLLYDYWFVQFDFPMTAEQAAAHGDPTLTGKPYKSSGGKMTHNKTLNREIPEGWEAGTIESLGQVVGGSTPSTKVAENFYPSGTPWITPKDLSNNGGKRFIGHGELFVSDQGIRSASLRLHPKGTVLMSSRAPVGYLAIAENPVTTNQGFKSIIPSLAGSSDYVYETLRTYMPVIKANASGSTFKEISGGTLKLVKIPVPTPDLVQEFSGKVSSLTAQMFNHQKQNQELAALRDWLLPMLMNGQVTVQS